MLLLADVDFFKPYNDTYGHVKGDSALKTIAKCFERLYPNHVYRFGGEELACLLPLETHQSAHDAAEQLRTAVQALAIKHKVVPLGTLTISVGVTHIQAGEAESDAISRADEQLYQAKRKSRNCVCGP
ncbi:GGDEF domain-containing protein [Aliidiomarina celeris]|uniref:GGDEF domain-containing protein n=1 Tax=Aliidiomarina celeris TaxID=2249428 RepID=UPI001E6495BE|nr:GGDEF domain-containing protein [Aliidiomarina celeris]